MRSEAEIRQYRDALKKVVSLPCGCSSGGHGEACRLGGIATHDAVRTLTWALGESDELSSRVETIVAGAARARP